MQFWFFALSKTLGKNTCTDAKLLRTLFPVGLGILIGIVRVFIQYKRSTENVTLFNSINPQNNNKNNSNSKDKLPVRSFCGAGSGVRRFWSRWRQFQSTCVWHIHVALKKNNNKNKKNYKQYTDWESKSETNGKAVYVEEIQMYVRNSSWSSNSANDICSALVLNCFCWWPSS